MSTDMAGSPSTIHLQPDDYHLLGPEDVGSPGLRRSSPWGRTSRCRPWGPSSRCTTVVSILGPACATTRAPAMSGCCTPHLTL